MLESLLDIDLASVDDFLDNVILVDGFAISLKHIDRLQVATIGSLHDSLPLLGHNTEQRSSVGAFTKRCRQSLATLTFLRLRKCLN